MSELQSVFRISLHKKPTYIMIAAPDAIIIGSNIKINYIIFYKDYLSSGNKRKN
jgi:hypothetical protein